MSNPSLSFEDNLSFEKSYLHSASFSYSGLPSSSSSSQSSTNASFSSSSQSSYSSTLSKTESVHHDLSSSTTSSDTRPQSDSNNIAALKEWAIICKAAEDGKQVLLFRKGGIMEYRNGFELKYKNFFLFPTFEHQSIDSIRNEYKIAIRKFGKPT